MSNFSGTIEVERNSLCEYESLYQIIKEFKEVHSLFMVNLKFKDEDIVYSFRSNYIDEDEVFYCVGNIKITFQLIRDQRRVKFEIYDEDENKFLMMYRSLRSIVNKHYK